MSLPHLESTTSGILPQTEPLASEPKSAGFATAFGCPRDSLNNRFVYLVVSPRARGLSIGVNLNPDKYCNFDCIYCEVNRELPGREQRLVVDEMAAELQQTLSLVHSGRIRERGWYGSLPEELLQLRHVSLSGDGEPTLCPNFAEAVQAVIHLRALSGFPFFKIVLITNATGADLPQVQQALAHFTKRDEIWAKLEAGTQAYMDKVNRSNVPLDKVMANILSLGRQRPIVIQSLFPLINGEEPSLDEIDHYAKRVQELVSGGAQISLVQIYSATRPTPHSECGHLPLKSLSRIAQTVKRATGLRVEVF
ncbi:MAG: radical SAM protein [Verrucomicrobia bacterium]|nr:radical SAM protein [Verrucomicrobiota bacterium]